MTKVWKRWLSALGFRPWTSGLGLLTSALRPQPSGLGFTAFGPQRMDLVFRDESIKKPCLYDKQSSNC